LGQADKSDAACAPNLKDTHEDRGPVGGLPSSIPMIPKALFQDLARIVKRPQRGSPEYEGWLQQGALRDLLAKQREQGTDALLLAAARSDGGHLYLHSVLARRRVIENIADKERLAHWDWNTFDASTCGLVTGGGKPPRVEFDPPRGHIGPADAPILGIQLVFERSFSGREVDQKYAEINSALVHAHGLHWTPEKRAWCRFDDDGNVEPVIHRYEHDEDGVHVEVIAIRRDVIELHLSAWDGVLVQLFDTTCVDENFSMYGGGHRIVVDSAAGIAMQEHVDPTRASYHRGTHVIPARESSEDCGARLVAESDRPKDYESFLISDVKNGGLVECRCDRTSLASYFEPESKLPFQISPVFFNADVLDRYKANPKKYLLTDRTITCRHAWSLKTYDVNEAGQVHTYICYLGDLPHSEQKYWQAFNEAPKGSISKRAFTTDIKGEFETEHDPMRALRSLVASIGMRRLPWFSPRSEDALNELHYPITESAKLWGEAISALDKCVVEGLVRKFFEKVINGTAMGPLDEKIQSIGALQRALQTKGLSEDDAKEIVAPFRDIRNWRSKLTGAHTSGSEAGEIRESLLKMHNSPKNHIAHECDRLAYALEQVESNFGERKATA
jgi:hypothetical protein